MKMNYFDTIIERLQAQFRSQSLKESNYRIPSLWVNAGSKRSQSSSITVEPASFFLDAITTISRIERTPLTTNRAGTWTRHAVIYNMFVRATCAYDHNGNGKIDLPVNSEGWRETGSFLKATALLPFIKSLGANTIHLLPVTSIGLDGNKGTLGSPYAIRNPYELDLNLHEPNAGLGVEEEFRLFVEAAHYLGMRVVVEFVFRTAAKDSDWIKEHPEWFYWIRSAVKDRRQGSHVESRYGNPIFTQGELKRILDDVERQSLDELVPPHRVYRDMFAPPPRADTVHFENGKYIGIAPDGVRVRIPGAFADWPPQDTQPPWGDVTYLKLYDHPDFNYIAYNTLRMYDSRLARRENANRELWETVSSIIPYYQHEFGIDGVMIDMGHALPMDLKREMMRRAREVKPAFAFWDENFAVSQKSAEEGYNAVVGYQWSDQHHPEKFKNMLRRFSTQGFPLPYLATPESHDTPRAAAREGGITYSKYAWATGNFLPAVPFIHSGFELGETYPVNTGLDFTAEDLVKFPSHRLPLFSECAYNWLADVQLIDWIRRVSSVRTKHKSLIENNAPASFRYVENPNPDIIAFMRSSEDERERLMIVANANMREARRFSVPIASRRKSLTDLLAGGVFTLQHLCLQGDLAGGQVTVFEL